MSGTTLPAKLKSMLSQPIDRVAKATAIAEVIRTAGDYRWVGIYDVDIKNGQISNVAWSGPSAPAHAIFPITKGLTSRAVASRKTVNVGDVAKETGYLATLDSTRSEIIVPVLHPASGRVVGTIDVESDQLNAFDAATESLLEQCARALADFWALQ
jgi:L-methionine (R)-S-oxide reductase